MEADMHKLELEEHFGTPCKSCWQTVTCHKVPLADESLNPGNAYGNTHSKEGRTGFSDAFGLRNFECISLPRPPSGIPCNLEMHEYPPLHFYENNPRRHDQNT